MTAEIEERVERMEGLIDALESRLDMTEVRLSLVSPRRAGRAKDSSADQQPVPSWEDATLKRIESMLRSVVLHEGGHTSDLRRTVRYLQLLVEGTKRIERS